MRSLIKYVIIALSVVSLQNTVPAIAKAVKGSVAVINAQRIVSESLMGKAASKELEDMFGKDRIRLEKEVKAYQEKEVALQKKMAALSANAKTKQAQELLTERQRLETESNTLTKKLQAEDGRLREKLLKAILEASQEVGKQRGVAMILDGTQAGVLYVEEQLDLTVDVLKVMDKKYK